MQKNLKFSSAGGSATRPPMASGVWEESSQTPNTVPPPVADVFGYAWF